ncbi:cell division protein SepF [Saccharopolyspora sp. HNM0983]|uniref:Cell division protein SepF n=1 Tax=Saccharopolyspora montiporae TaxID=2781240 RepID=A0A929B6Q5_9PSEU|nr:cell division protein SepF [Saccharopolyspora sp. HNM0983]MBE9374249.1 cell division protein SepF [Saccharopolyspora sp. HNM0983]
MSALHKLKAYFGMVPADEIDEYEDDPAYRDAGYRDAAYRDRYADPEPVDDRTAPRRRAGARASYQPDADGDQDGFGEEYREPVRLRRSWNQDAPVRSAAPADPPREPSRLRAVTDTGTTFSLSKITTLHPRSYSEARTIGEQYRDGTPVIMNLTEMEEADAKRLVDFAAGLAFALRGSIEKVTNRVFLLSPPNVDVAAEDKRRLAEGAFFNYG